jgi:hypothetical protein
VEAVGLPSIATWQSVTEKARHKGRLIGVEPKAYPAHFAAYATYHRQLQATGPRYRMPDPISITHMLSFFRDHADPTRVQLKAD